MDEIRALDGEKLKKKRGYMPLSEAARRTDGVYTRSSLDAIENGKFRPPPEKIPAVLKAYEATWEEVSSPIKPVKPARRGRRPKVALATG